MRESIIVAEGSTSGTAMSGVVDEAEAQEQGGLSLSNKEARAILKKHSAEWGDARYEPAMWVMDAVKEAFQQGANAAAPPAELAAGAPDAGEVERQRWVDIIERSIARHGDGGGASSNGYVRGALRDVLREATAKS